MFASTSRITFNCCSKTVTGEQPPGDTEESSGQFHATQPARLCRESRHVGRSQTGRTELLLDSTHLKNDCLDKVVSKHFTPVLKEQSARIGYNKNSFRILTTAQKSSRTQCRVVLLSVTFVIISNVKHQENKTRHCTLQPPRSTAKL